ncbi:MAG: hypothetical protein C4313_03480 [Thermoflexus sp.]
MVKIAVVTDSVACLPPELVEAYGIRVVPVRLILGEQVYAWQRAGILPTSSQPSVGDFLETYRELAAWAEGIVSIHVSAAMTGTYNAALLAAQMVPEVPSGSSTARRPPWPRGSWFWRRPGRRKPAPPWTRWWRGWRPCAPACGFSRCWRR